jgi:hypothetical protein
MMQPKRPGSERGIAAVQEEKTGLTAMTIAWKSVAAKKLGHAKMA